MRFFVLNADKKVFDSKVYMEIIKECDSLKSALYVQSKNTDGLMPLIVKVVEEVDVVEI
jgi:hypothetical protein